MLLNIFTAQDYTLVQYKQPAFDELAFNGAKEKLVKNLGYPEAVLDFEYDHEVGDVGCHFLSLCFASFQLIG